MGRHMGRYKGPLARSWDGSPPTLRWDPEDPMGPQGTPWDPRDPQGLKLWVLSASLYSVPLCVSDRLYNLLE